MPVWSDMNGFPEGGFPVLANDNDMICLNQLYLNPLKTNQYIIDVLGNNRLAGALTIAGALSGCAGIAAGGAITGATTIAANNTVTLSSATAPLTISGASAVVNMSGENANILMSGLNSSIGTILQKVKKIFAKSLFLDERPMVGDTPVALISDLIIQSYERHIQISAMADGKVANQPTPEDFFTAGGLQFASAGSEYAYCQWEIPQDWNGGDIYFEIDWMPDSGGISGTDAVRWTIEYRAIAEGEAINNGTSVTLDNGAGGDTTDYAQYVTKHTRVTLAYNDANQPLTKQDHVYFKISRDTSVANDFAGTVTVLAYEIIYNSVGIPTN